MQGESGTVGATAAGRGKPGTRVADGRGEAGGSGTATGKRQEAPRKVHLKSGNGLDLESKSDEEWLVELVGLSLENRRLRRDLVALHNSLTGGDSQGRGRGLLTGIKGQEERQGLKLCQGRFKLDIKKNMLTEMIAKDWNGLPREVV
ncbi:hypothetical protein TURU_013306 [Turdus rufiventris]|nr:hypothetical protein TURU_013306 [Turdus rufiventris]